MSGYTRKDRIKITIIREKIKIEIVYNLNNKEDGEILVFYGLQLYEEGLRTTCD
jgi:hypothetical protein